MKSNYIANISARGLKSGDFAHDLDRVNLIIGRSASGKTARLDALRLALNGGTLLGRASDLKARTIDIMDLARNGHIEVQAVDNDGRKIGRRWARGKNCVVTAQDIRQTPNILMDPAEYLGLSDAKKIEYAFNLYKMPETESAERIMAEIKNVRLEDNTTESESLLNEILAVARGTNEGAVQVWLSDLIAVLKLRLSAAKAAANRMTQTVQGITSLQTEETLRNPEKELEGERRNLQILRDGLATLQKQQADLKDIIRRRSDILEQIVDLGNNPLQVATIKNEIEQTEAYIVRIESSPLALPTHLMGETFLALGERLFAVEEKIKSIPVSTCPTCGGPTINSECKPLELERDQIRAKQAELFSAQSKAQIERDGILIQKRAYVSQLRRDLDGIQSAVNNRSTLEARLIELPVEGPSVDSLTAEIAKVNQVIEETAKRVEALDKQRTAFIQWKTDEARNAQALIQHRKDVQNAALTSAVVERLETMQAEMVERAFDSILKTVNAVAGALIKEPIQYRAGEIGRWIGDTFVRHESFSMTEKGLTHAGISMALAKDAPIKIVMLDELGRMDSDSLTAFMDRMVVLAGNGLIDQFVGCLSTCAPMAFSGVRLIKI